MPTALLPFGGPLDRGGQAVQTQPASMRDVRNAHYDRDRLVARKGHVYRDGLGGSTDVLAVQGLQTEQIGVAVGYNSGTGAIRVYRTTGRGNTPVELGVWHTLPSGSPFPIIVTAEVGGRVFLAHDEPLIAQRAPTIYYDTNNDATGRVRVAGAAANLFKLQADFGTGLADLKFRGVLQFLDYLIGWSFGTATEDRPEFVRVSKPGEPLKFERNHYFIAGARGVPVTGCNLAGGNLMVFKHTQRFRVLGTNRLNFGILPIDTLSGCEGSRLSISVHDVCYYWSQEGPRATRGGAAEDLAAPLDLRGPKPSDLQEAGPIREAFVVYRPGREEIEWIFGKLGYALDLTTGKWGYRTYWRAFACGGLLYSGGSALGATGGGAVTPTAYATIASTAPGATLVDVTFDVLDSIGNEQYELWIKAGAGAWSQAASAAFSGTRVVARATGLAVNTAHTAAVRIRRDGAYTTGYTDPNPDNWPASSRASFTTTLNAPTLNSATWSRTGTSVEQVALAFTLAHADVPLQVYRDGSLLVTLAAGVNTYVDTTITGERTHSYRARHASGLVEGPWSASLGPWTGPTPEPNGLGIENLGFNQYRVTWTPGALPTAVYHKASGLPEQRVATVGAGIGEYTGYSSTEISVYMRFVQTAHGTEDFSPASIHYGFAGGGGRSGTELEPL